MTLAGFAKRFPIHKKNTMPLDSNPDRRMLKGSEPISKTSNRKKEDNTMATTITPNGTTKSPSKPVQAKKAEPVKAEPVKVDASEAGTEVPAKPARKRGGPRLGMEFYADFIKKYQACNSMAEAMKATGLTEARIRELVANLRTDNYKTVKNPDGSESKTLVKAGIKTLKVFPSERAGGARKSIDWSALAELAKL